MKSLFFLKLFFISIITNVNLYADNLDNRNFIYVKEYLNNLNSLEADFLQVSSDGDIKEGKISFSFLESFKILVHS